MRRRSQRRKRSTPQWLLLCRTRRSRRRRSSGGWGWRKRRLLDPGVSSCPPPLLMWPLSSSSPTPRLRGSDATAIYSGITLIDRTLIDKGMDGLRRGELWPAGVDGLCHGKHRLSLKEESRLCWCKGRCF
jgi:hypothetical protein